MFFSIIIPIYNAERSLEKCLNSINDQSFHEYEVILVDDGSKDSSYVICQEFAKKDSRFCLIHQDNKGVSSARNAGLERAKGDYICFVDSDDYISPDYLKYLYERIESGRADALFIGYYKVNKEGEILNTFLPPAGLDGIGLMMELSDRDMFGYTWIKCFSRKIIADNLFPEEMSLFEDEVFACRVLEKARKVGTLPLPLYYYVCDGEGMLTGRTHKDFCTLSDKVFLAWEELLSGPAKPTAYLEKKANTFVERCRYYGFERNVDYRSFFESLSNTKFFQEHTRWSRFDRQLQKGNWLAVKAAIAIYRLKNRLFHRL